MTQKLEIYKCEVCGNIVEVTHEGVGTLVCCGQPMTKMVEKSTDAGNEKHVPVPEKAEDGTLSQGAARSHIRWRRSTTSSGSKRYARTVTL